MIPKPEFPRPDRERKTWLNLNGEWDFRLVPEGADENSLEGFDRKIIVPFSWVSPLSGIGENEKGIGWYRRFASFKAEGRVFLCFGAVDYIADIYVNGTHVCHHQGGYNQFDIDVTNVWHEGENEIVVRAEDFRDETQTYGKQGYGDIQGIWQTVWLEERGASYIDSFRTVTKITGDVTITAKVCAPDGETVTASFDGKTFTGEVRDNQAVIGLKIDSPRLWSPDMPTLYEGTLTLGADTVYTYFGIREIETKDGRILLNGEPIYINGTLDQAFHPQGHFTYPSDQVLQDEAWRLKRLGLNMARIHIKCEEPRKLYWMDKLGLLIMQDIPCFWSEPNETARKAYEAEWPHEFDRDYNHPCIFAWVMFNESWGLRSGLDKDRHYREYLKDTQEWVRSVYHAAKENDPTRIVEDNSPCYWDHVETDINTWHFYINTYDSVRKHIQKIVKNTYEGSKFNYIGGNKQNGAPLMNSECGMVWGVEGSAGDSDIAWQYRYMLNEYRLHDLINGFVFTEFHDVVNEFNGYYRIDDTDKDFGYQDFCRGMTIRDLHSADFLALDCPPCRTVKAGAKAQVPCALSSFTSAHRKKGLTVKWELWHESEFGRITDDAGEFKTGKFETGCNPLEPIRVKMPKENCVAILSVYLLFGDKVISRNFTTFDVRAELNEDTILIPVTEGASEGFSPRWTAIQNDKLCLGGAGSVSFEIPAEGGIARDISVTFEAGAKRVLTKDQTEHDSKSDLDFMRGYLVDRGAFKNSYWMTDEDKPLSRITVKVNGVEIAKKTLTGDNADARGVLSWHYQPEERKLDEAGSYGELICLNVPSRLIPAIAQKGSFTLTIEADNGLALYGRNSGRYGTGLQVKFDR